MQHHVWPISLALLPGLSLGHRLSPRWHLSNMSASLSSLSPASLSLVVAGSIMIVHVYTPSYLYHIYIFTARSRFHGQFTSRSATMTLHSQTATCKAYPRSTCVLSMPRSVIVRDMCMYINTYIYIYIERERER